MGVYLRMFSNMQRQLAVKTLSEGCMDEGSMRYTNTKLKVQAVCFALLTKLM